MCNFFVFYMYVFDSVISCGFEWMLDYKLLIMIYFKEVVYIYKFCVYFLKDI